MKHYVAYYLSALLVAHVAQATWKPEPRLIFDGQNLGAICEALEKGQVTDDESQEISEQLSRASSHDIQLEEYCEL